MSEMQLWALLLWVGILAFFFAKVEVHIEGADGWASKLPTWRIERHKLLDILWAGKPLTGYHVWVFAFMALVFHLPSFLTGDFSWPLEERILGSLMLFWIVEDFLWFALNPHYGLRRFRPGQVPWHRHWIGLLPAEYWLFGVLGVALLWQSYRAVQAP
jgi:hypothetical protein